MSGELMPFLVTATDARGRRDTFARDAASLEHLRNMLEREGYTEIEFVDDELSARLRQQRPEEGKPRTAAEYRFEAKQRHGDRPLDAWLLAIRKSLLPLLVTGAAGTYGVLSGKPGWTIGAAVLLVAWVWLIKRGRARAGGYDALLRVFARGEWDAAAALIARLAAAPALADNEQLQQDLAFRSAMLRARDGDLAGALADVAPLRDTVHGAAGVFEGRVASIHYLAGDLPGFVAAMEQAYAASGQAELQRLDLAFAHARVGDTGRARELLAAVDRRNLSALHKPIAVAVEGLIARREDDEDGGALLLGDAVAGLAAFSANPAAWPIFGILVGHHALALARSGDRDDANLALEGWHEVVDACLDAPTRGDLHAALKA